jgi:hypothetical protein
VTYHYVAPSSFKWYVYTIVRKDSKYDKRVKLDLRGIGYEGVDRIELAQYRAQCASCTRKRISWFHKSGKFVDQLSDCSFSRKTLHHAVNNSDTKKNENMILKATMA